MKRLLLALLIVAGSAAIATNAKAQIYVGAHVSLRPPFHRVYCAPQVIYNAPVYSAPAPLPYYDDGVVIDANVYNNYPVYHGYSHYPYYHHNFGRGYYRGMRIRHERRR
jgi:hypothetical protein